MSSIEKPIRRSAFRQKAGMAYYGLMRRFLWIRMNRMFASSLTDEKLPFLCFSHQTLLLRKLKDVDMRLQYNKITNLKIAAKKLNGIILHPGEVFSYWKLIGKPTKRRGYLDGLILQGGSFHAGTGGGLCQLSNLIFWMTMHTPLTVIERHRHGYDVFPDSNRTQPFGSGATCFYPHGDLMLRNDTEDDYQLIITVGEQYLEGEWRVSARPRYTYKVVERNHEMKGEYWGGYSRHNEIYQQKFDLQGQMIEEKLLIKNAAIMMYSPFLSEQTAKPE
ncbi:VanW family protein [Candidatus Soleaferrea massiliensis]|uniref:VanW family protein n=1 Tax=Candidatus Soleaferrea massiliensis TaxID=1470354 RepID=UPI00058E15CE|nr:VanW family protein [Candidatus Soleaferrea massiliensis]